MPLLKNRPLYLWDVEFQFSDLLEFIEFSEWNLEWQRHSQVQRLSRKAKLEKYQADDYYSALDDIEFRFGVNLSRNIRYSAVIGLATSIEWIAKFLEERLAISLSSKPKGVNKSIHILRSLFQSANSLLVHNLDTLEGIIRIRNCIAHSMGSVENYEHGDEVKEILKTLRGFGISNKHFLDGTLEIEKGAIESIITETQAWIVDFIEECRQKNLISI